MLDIGIHISISLFLALFFVGSAFHKFANRAAFKEAIKGYGIISGFLVDVASFALPVMELLAAVLILLPGFGFVGLSMAVGLLVFYMLMILVALKNGHAGEDCGCSWGASERSTPLSSSLVYRNLVLIVVAAIALPQPEMREIIWLDWVTALMTSIAGLLMVQVYSAYVSVVHLQKESGR